MSDYVVLYFFVHIPTLNQNIFNCIRLLMVLRK